MGQPQATAEAEATYTSGPLRGLNSNVIRMGLVSFFADVSSEMLYPLTPIFLTLVLHAPFIAVGFIEGAAEATASLLRTVSGRMSDRSGRRRPYVLAGYSLSALAKPLIGLAGGWPLVLIARVADRFGKGLRSSPRDALLADSVPPAYRGRAFGWHRAMDTLGAVLGPLLAIGLLLLTRGDLRLIFLLAFIPGLIGAALVLTLREHRHAVPPKGAAPFAWGTLPPAFRGYLIAWGIFALTNSSDIFLILKAQAVLTPEATHSGWLQSLLRPFLSASPFLEGTILVVLLYVLYNLVYALASPYLGSLSDRLGRKCVLVGGLLIFALVYLGFAFARIPWQIWILFICYGLYTAATDGVGKALAVDLVPSQVRASAIGLLGTVTGLATLAASSIAGVLWTVKVPFGIAGWATFAYGAAGALLGSVLLLLLVRTKPAPPPATAG